MHYSRATVIHASFVLAQPTYLAVQYLLNYEHFKSTSSITWIIHVMVWVYIATRISIPFFTSPLRRLPSPPGERFPLCHLDFNGGRPPTAVFENMVNSTPNDGLLVLWLPLYLGCQIIPTRPDTLMDILNSHNYDWEKPALTKKVLGRVLGEGLASVEGTKHKAMRRVVAPAFSGHRVRDLAPLFYVNGIALTEAIARQARLSDDGALELMPLFSRVTLDIIGAAGVGMDFNSLGNEESLLAKLYNLATHPPASFLLINTLFPSWLIRNLRGTAYARAIEVQSQLRDEVCALMQQKKAHINQEKSAQEDGDIMASIMKSGDFSDDYLVSQLLTFLAAGHNTTASAMIWATWLLSLHPKIQDRLRAECNAQLAYMPTSEEVNASILDPENMPFLTAVCNETLRLYAPAPATARYAVVPTTIGSVHIPRGTTATIAPWAINRSHVLWGADAAEFNPDRWLEGPNAATGGATGPYAFLTFLYGPRSCIGQSFARLEMKCLLAILVTRFRLEAADPDQKVEIGGFVTIKPQDSLRFKVHDLKETSQ